MIIDIILDRKDGYGYNARQFYCYCNGNGEHGNDIARALDAGTNTDVCNAINAYIIENGYNTDICDYVSGCNWLEDEDPQRGYKIIFTPEEIAAFMASQNA